MVWLVLLSRYEAVQGMMQHLKREEARLDPVRYRKLCLLGPVEVSEVQIGVRGLHAWVSIITQHLTDMAWHGMA